MRSKLNLVNLCLVLTIIGLIAGGCLFRSSEGPMRKPSEQEMAEWAKRSNQYYAAAPEGSATGNPADAPPTLDAPQAAQSLRPVLAPMEPVSLRQEAAEALSRIGPPAVPALIAALESADPTTRSHACWALGMIGPMAKDAVPYLVARADDPVENVRRAAIQALGRLGPAAGDAVPTLLRVMSTPSTNTTSNP